VFGGGNISFPSGSTDYHGFFYSVGGKTSITGATLTVDDDMSTAGFQFDSGLMNMIGSFHMSGTGTWSGGTIAQDDGEHGALKLAEHALERGRIFQRIENSHSRTLFANAVPDSDRFRKAPSSRDCNRRSLPAHTVSNFSMMRVSASPALVHSAKAGNDVIASM